MNDAPIVLIELSEDEYDEIVNYNPVEELRPGATVEDELATALDYLRYVRGLVAACRVEL